MIANCPSCGTHYKHEPPTQRVRARCGRCDATLDLSRLRPYRIVPTGTPTLEQRRDASRHLPIGLDHPGLATAIATNVARNVKRPSPETPAVRPQELWEAEDPLPPIPEMTPKESVGESGAARNDMVSIGLKTDLPGGTIGASAQAEAPAPEASGGVATFLLWVATGVITGTGLSWTMGGTTLTGMIAGAALGALAGWGWLRWTSPQ